MAFGLLPHQADLPSILNGIGSKFKLTKEGFEADLNSEERDRVVDALRAAKLSITSLSESKVSLEDAFIDLIEEVQS